jgi:hypothetical protein
MAQPGSMPRQTSDTHGRAVHVQVLVCVMQCSHQRDYSYKAQAQQYSNRSALDMATKRTWHELAAL